MFVILLEVGKFIGPKKIRIDRQVLYNLKVIVPYILLENDTLFNRPKTFQSSASGKENLEPENYLSVLVDN